MAKKTKKEKNTSKRAKRAATKASAATATSVRAKAAHRTAEGKFTKIIFNQIGRKECRRFAAITWKERDAFMAKPENAVVRDATKSIWPRFSEQVQSRPSGGDARCPRSFRGIGRIAFNLPTAALGRRLLSDQPDYR